MNYPALSLRALAGVTGITSAVAAYPVAAQLFGAVPGGVVLASSAAVIYAGWHVVATSSDTDKRVIAGAVAAAFAAAMVAGIHNSAQLATVTAATSAATSADKLYQDQESARMAALSAVTAELRATSKNKYPGEYANLQAQVDKLSTPTVRQATASQITQGLTDTGGVYRWAVASVFELVTPALLLLAGMFTRRQREQVSVTAVNATSTPVNSVLTPEKQPVNDIQPTTVNSVASVTVDPLTALVNREATPTAEGNITAEQVVNAVGCTIRQARDAIKAAFKQGHLVKVGEGNSARYRYNNKLRIVK